MGSNQNELQTCQTLLRYATGRICLAARISDSIETDAMIHASTYPSVLDSAVAFNNAVGFVLHNSMENLLGCLTDLDTTGKTDSQHLKTFKVFALKAQGQISVLYFRAEARRQRNLARNFRKEVTAREVRGTDLELCNYLEAANSAVGDCVAMLSKIIRGAEDDERRQSA
jgi:hypothetical protein